MRKWDPPYISTPPPPSLQPKTSLPMLYYGLVVVAAAALVLAIYNLIIVKWCANQRQRFNDTNSSLEVASLSRTSIDNSSINNLGISFKYKKGEDLLHLGYDNQDCPVCLSVFEQGEEVKQLPMCKHSFHAPCIDMWLYSHSDCPLCRAPVQLPEIHQRPSTSGTSRDLLMDQQSCPVEVEQLLLQKMHPEAVAIETILKYISKKIRSSLPMITRHEKLSNSLLSAGQHI